MVKQAEISGEGQGGGARLEKLFILKIKKHHWTHYREC